MKRLDGVVIALCVVGLVVPTLVLMKLPNNEKYPKWGSVDYFGEGRFQILRGPTGSAMGTTLHDLDAHDTLLSNVEDWQRKGDWVYVVGKDGMVTRPYGDQDEPVYVAGTTNQYVVLNHRTGFWRKYKKLQDIPLPHRAEAERLAAEPAHVKLWRELWR